MKGMILSAQETCCQDTGREKRWIRLAERWEQLNNSDLTSSSPAEDMSQRQIKEGEAGMCL